MKYFPILQELFESDTAVFLLLGLVGALIIGLGGLALKKRQKLLRALVASLAVYAACEVGAGLPTNFGLEIGLVSLGTVALGCALGFLIMTCIRLFRQAKK